jgi:uncharacterized membrane protein
VNAVRHLRATRIGIEVQRTITITRSRDEVFAALRRLADLPRFMQHVHHVEELDPTTSRWRIDADGVAVEWTVELTDDRPPRRLAWRSRPGADLEQTGAIELRDAPGDRGTEVRLALTYRPAGALANDPALRRFLRRYTSVQLDTELARLRELLEAL